MISSTSRFWCMFCDNSMAHCPYFSKLHHMFVKYFSNIARIPKVNIIIAVALFLQKHTAFDIDLIWHTAKWQAYTSHDDVIKWKHFPRYWSFVRGIHRWPVNSQKPVTRTHDVFFDLRLNKRLSKQTLGWKFETPSRSWWRQCNGVNSNTLYRKIVKQASFCFELWTCVSDRDIFIITITSLANT